MDLEQKVLEKIKLESERIKNKERLTKRDEFGNADIIGVDSMDLQCNLGFNEFNKVTNALNKLATYEDLEEQGKMLKLPCAVGDMVYTLCPLPSGKTVIAETPADAFFCALSMQEGRFGKTIFLTMKEAEAALKELNEKEGEGC